MKAAYPQKAANLFFSSKLTRSCYGWGAVLQTNVRVARLPTKEYRSSSFLMGGIFRQRQTTQNQKHLIHNLLYLAHETAAAGFGALDVDTTREARAGVAQ